MKTTFTHISALLAFAILAPVTMAADPTTDKQVTKTEVTTTTEVKPAAPEAGTISRMIKDSASFSILSKAIDASGLGEMLESKGPNTIFAPTDEAFTKLPKGTLEKLMLPENKEKLRALISYHIVPGDFPSTALKDGELKTVEGDKLKIDVDGKVIKVNDAKVVNSDLLATNGTIHVVDHVLMSKKLEVAKIDK
jgi:uncharacterized surface protein with fasciclin (FAS1) repeats